MRKARIKHDGEGWYHVVSRTAFQLFKFEAADRNMFVAMLRRVARFCGVEVLNFCVMSNHFHILLHVPEPVEISEGELLSRIAVLYGNENAKELRGRWNAMRKRRQFKAVESEMEKYRRRMGDMSEFMKTLKQRFSIWYRHHHESFTGTLWEGRFKSVIVQGVPASLSAVSAYIDLNPVRARMVDDPAKYKWCGYGAAMAGDTVSMQGIARVFRQDAGAGDFIEIAEAHYREILYVTGRDAMGEEKAREVIAAGGKLPMSQFVRCRVRHFIDGVCVGDAGFVEGIFATYRDHFSVGRKNGARGIGLCEKWCGIQLCTARKLVRNTISAI